ncbi:Putative cytochrome P450 [Septoria linicola]|uniref:Cytochrome P450 n=1 Tax=Septoria linicola TaxID=215465 RepID=A0A9Q9EJ07_9PEZI|nr:Putative cytochrome P450 [Septoria linicola]
MSPLQSLQSIEIWATAVALILYALYRRALPKPIPGIPHNKHAAQRLLGDAPDALAWKKKTGSLFLYIPELARQLNEPVFQMFMQPLGKPWVILVDPYESHDIRTRRMQEFDRSIFFEQIFSTLAPQFHVHMPTGDDWKAHRKLVSETMSTRFLHDVAAPRMWSSAIALVELWKTKAKLAAGRPWDAADDVFKGALDIVWAATFGADIGSTGAQAKFLERNGDLQLSSDIDEVVVFPTGEDPEDFTAILELGQSEEAVKRKDKMIAEQLRAAYNKLIQLQAQDKLDLNKHFRSALDLIVAKEVQMASREGRAVDVTNQVIPDELFGFIIAGHDTTSTFICWTLKFLTDNRDAQHKLYGALCSAFVGVTCGQSNARPVPSTTEISSTSIPYLEAVIEESGRLGLTSPATIRVTRCEPEILGHRVPAGIDVFLSNAGPGCVSPLVGEVDDAKRSKGGMDQKQKWGM